MKNLKRILFAAVIISAATLTSCKDDEEANALKCLQCDGQVSFCEGDEVDGVTITRADLESTLEGLNSLTEALGGEPTCSLVDKQ